MPAGSRHWLGRGLKTGQVRAFFRRLLIALALEYIGTCAFDRWSMTPQLCAQCANWETTLASLVVVARRLPLMKQALT